MGLFYGLSIKIAAKPAVFLVVTNRVYFRILPDLTDETSNYLHQQVAGFCLVWGSVHWGYSFLYKLNGILLDLLYP